jgi:uncharacterized protein YjbI with pentapeptide repeats
VDLLRVESFVSSPFYFIERSRFFSIEINGAWPFIIFYDSMAIFTLMYVRVAHLWSLGERVNPYMKGRLPRSIKVAAMAALFLPQISLLDIAISSKHLNVQGVCAAENGSRGGTGASTQGGSSVAIGIKYLGKDFIDSTVLRAIFIINDAASVAGVGFREKESIQEARRVAQRLKSVAKGDPNERYAMWKVNELEWLIYLEEKDLVLQKMKEGQGTVNQLIADYNTEVGKARPDFKQLFRLHSQMSELDITQANAMAESINKRTKVVSREVVIALERALMYANEPHATEEFRYCLRNRPYLVIADSKFSQLETQVSACARARDELPVVKSEIDKAQKLLEKNRLGEARLASAAAQYRFSDVRNFVPEQEAGPVNLRFSQIERMLSQKEDSLVRVNMEILKTKGVGSANEYLQKVLLERGVSRGKTGLVDQAILAIASPEEKSAMEKEIDDVAASADETGPTDVMGEMRAKAAKKAQQKLDSIKAVEETKSRWEMAYQDKLRLERETQEKARLEKEHQEQARLDKERQEQARIENERQEKAREEQARLDKERQERERQAKAREEQARLDREREEQARQEQARLEQTREKQARLDSARKENDRLEQARLQEARLEQARLEQAHQAQAHQEEQARLDKERQEKARLEQARQEREKQARLDSLRQEQTRKEQARLEKERQEQTRLEQARLEQTRLERSRQEQARLEKDRQEQSRQELARREIVRREQARQDSLDAEARKPVDRDRQKNQDLALHVAENIYQLIEKNKSRVASELFTMKKTILKQNLTGDAFAMLEATVKQAAGPQWESKSDDIAYLVPKAGPKQPVALKPSEQNKVIEGGGNREKAMDIIAKVYELLERNDAKGAYERLDRDRPFLKTYLDKEAYDVLNATIIQAYNATR